MRVGKGVVCQPKVVGILDASQHFVANPGGLRTRQLRPGHLLAQAGHPNHDEHPVRPECFTHDPRKRRRERLGLMERLGQGDDAIERRTRPVEQPVPQRRGPCCVLAPQETGSPVEVEAALLERRWLQIFARSGQQHSTRLESKHGVWRLRDPLPGVRENSSGRGEVRPCAHRVHHRVERMGRLRRHLTQHLKNFFGTGQPQQCPRTMYLRQRANFTVADDPWNLVERL